MNLPNHALSTALVLAILLLAGPIDPITAGEITLRPYTGSRDWAYGLEIVPPWDNGGHIAINLPEHAEFKTTSNSGILREYDKTKFGADKVGAWIFAKDGKSATLDAISHHNAGLKVKATAKVAEGGRVIFSFTVENAGKVPLPGVQGLFCHHYRFLTGFPQDKDNYQHTFVRIDGKVVALADLPTEKPDAQVKGGLAGAVLENGASPFVDKHGGRLAKPLDAAIVAVSALEGQRKILLAWTPGQSMLSNKQIPCIHADPYFGDIAPGQSVTANGVLVFTEAPLEEAFAALTKEHAGDPPKPGAAPVPAAGATAPTRPAPSAPPVPPTPAPTPPAANPAPPPLGR